MHTTEGTQSKRRNGGARWEHAGMGCALHSPREVRYARTAPMAGIWRGMAAGKRGGAAALAARAVVRGHGPTIPRTSDGRRGPTEPSAMIATSVLNRSTVYSVIVLGRETDRSEDVEARRKQRAGGEGSHLRPFSMSMLHWKHSGNSWLCGRPTVERRLYSCRRERQLLRRRRVARGET